METLSNKFKKCEVFNEEFNKISPSKPFTKVYILSYISSCIEVVQREVQKRYPDRHLIFVNPIFIVDRQIYPVPFPSGDETVLKLLRPFFSLIQSKIIIPLSIPILENLLSGVVLGYNNPLSECHYKLFKAFDLDIFPYDIDLNLCHIDQNLLVGEIKDMTINCGRFSDAFINFSNSLLATSCEDKIKLFKTLIVYKNISKAIDSSLVYSFVNKYNQTQSFFDCMLTFISQKPFNEDELLDFGNIIEGISLPIANYDYNKSKGISPKTVAVRSSLNTMLNYGFMQHDINF